MGSIHISASNLFLPGFNALTFSLAGLIIVFVGLASISIYIYFLPKILNTKKKKKVDRRTYNPSEDDSNTQSNLEEMIAIATAIHLETESGTINQEMTWNNESESRSWQVSGKVHSFNLRNKLFTGARK